MKNLTLAILGALIVFQFAVPFHMIKSRENVLRNGELFRFRTRPIDPADPFQGRFVRLGIDMDYVPCPKEQMPKLAKRTPIYAQLETNSAGFASFTQWSKEEPEGSSYLKTRYLGARGDWNRETEIRTHKGIRIQIPFNRFYMDEAKAPRAERLAREASRSTNCWVNVRILNGKAVIEGVFAEGQSLRELASEKDE